MGGWVGPDGVPLSWKHYVVGTQYLQRAASRDQLRTYEAVNVAQAANREDRVAWVNRLTIHAGW